MTDPGSAALAAQFGGVPVTGSAVAPPPVAAAVPAGGGNDALARQFGGVPVGSTEQPLANYKQTDTTPNEVDPETFGTFARHVWAGINPLNIGQLLPLPKVLGGSGMDHPLLKVLPEAMKLRDEAGQAWDAGDKTRAAALYLDSLLPIIGPLAHKAATSLEQGKYAAGGGDLMGFLGPLLLGSMAKGSTMTPAVAKAGGSLTAAEEAANAFADAKGVPLDAATRTGSPFVRGVQKVAGESMVGAPAVAEARAGQATALQRVGGEIADSVHPTAVTPEDAGAGVTGSIRSVMAKLHQSANESYGALRKLEEDAPAEQVAGPAAPVDALKDWQKAQLRRITHELDASGYTAGKLQTTEEGDLGVGSSGAVYQGRTGGAKVYHDITENLGHTSLDRGEVQAELESYLGGGKETAAVKAALKVAKDRFMGSTKITTPELPASAMDLPTKLEAARETTRGVKLAVDLTDAKAAVRPIYDRLTQENSVAPLQGGKAEALRALDRVINGPDHAPLSVAEAALGDLKSLARSDDPLTRTAGQGVAAKAVGALSEAVNMRAAAAGNDAYDALQAGRAATKAKYGAADVLDQLRAEPVAVYKQMTAPKDANIGLLRQVAELAPDHLPAVGRAKLEEWLDAASERGRFDHADRLYAEWNKLGPETKRLLFGKADAVQALDRFFLLAKRIGENPNPSGTAPTLLKTGEITAVSSALFSGHPGAALASLGTSATLGGIAKLLYSPKGVKALTRVLELETKAAAGKAVGRAATEAAWLDLSQAGNTVGVPIAVPKAADRSDPR